MKRVPSKSERWIVLGAGVGVLLTVGAALSWSVYAHPLMALFDWSSLQVASVFATFSFCLGIGAIAGGVLHDRFGPKRAVLVGALLWGAAGIVSGVGLGRFGVWWLSLWYGVVGGVACGMMYVVPGATAAKWFPEERGLANGIVLCGFGFGALVFNLIIGAFPAFTAVTNASAQIIGAREAALAAGHVLARSVADGDVATMKAAFIVPGVVYAIVGSLCALVLHSPPPGYFVPKAAAELARERDFTPGEMLRTRAFYLVWIMLFVNATCGLALFSNAVPIYARVAGIAAAAATLAFGTISAANGIGRLLWAWLSDVIGRMPSLSLCFALEGIGLWWLARAHGQTTAVFGFAIVLLCFGGIFAIIPAIMAEFFGTRFFGEDYSFIITAASVAGLIGPLLVGGLEQIFGSLTAWLEPVAVALLLTAALPALTGRPSFQDTPARKGS
ncbi:MAG: OFA family MFS transporter [Candidatus Eremiobacteraeota bacterium]|nr:OFA family MFS transporter [Candidatus Eremiobacteraeota bacterium]